MHLQIHYEKNGQVLLVLQWVDIKFLCYPPVPISLIAFKNRLGSFIPFQFSSFTIYVKDIKFLFFNQKLDPTILNIVENNIHQIFQGNYHIMDNKIQEFYYKHAYKVMKLQITCPQAHVIKLTSYFSNYSLKEAPTPCNYIKLKDEM
jgi:hypothetical protein